MAKKIVRHYQLLGRVGRGPRELHYKAPCYGRPRDRSEAY